MTLVRRTALQLEALNDRIVPAVTFAEVNGTLTVTGDQRANDIEITDDGTASGVTVTVGDTEYHPTQQISQVVVDSRGGSDTVSYNLTGDYVGTMRTVQVFLGNGKDTFTADLGHAIDSASIFALRVVGGNGKDSLTVDASGNVAGQLTVSLEGGNGMDDLSFNFTGELTGTLRAVADGGNGKDTIDYHVSAADTSTGTVFAQVFGGNGKDTLGLAVEGGTLSVDATVDGGHGKDIFDPSITDNVTIVDADKH
jgi:hypothetical protein